MRSGIDEIRPEAMQIRMDWRSITFDWNRARAFLVTAEEGSLSAAARALSMAQPTLGRQVSALEEELGVTLFERVGRGLALTDAGRDLLEHVRDMGTAASAVALAATGQNQAIDGPISITASEAYAAFLVPPIVDRIRSVHPGIQVHIVASNDLSDLRRREADIAIRNTRPEDPDLIAKKIRDDRATLYASTAFMATHGPFPTPQSLSKATFLGFEDNAAYVAGLQSHGINLEDEAFPIIAANHLVHWSCVRSGLGIGVMSEHVASLDETIVEAAPWMDKFVFPVWLVTHRELHTSRRVRVVFDLLAECLSPREKRTP